MKKIAIIAVMGLVLAGMLNAQDIRTQVETTTISGKLVLENGLIAVQNGEKTYFAFGFHHLIGFIDGLKEGADVTLEGYHMPVTADSENQYFMSTKLTVNGKSYDLQTPYGQRGMGFQRDMNSWQNDRGPMLHRNTFPRHHDENWQNDRDSLRGRDRQYYRDRQDHRDRGNSRSHDRGRW